LHLVKIIKGKETISAVNEEMIIKNQSAAFALGLLKKNVTLFLHKFKLMIKERENQTTSDQI